MRHVVLALLACAATAWGQCPSSYAAQRSITVNGGQVTGTLANFSMLVLNPTSGQADPNNLKTTANGGRVTSSSGYDIIFVDAGGALLPFELVGHGGAGTSYSAGSGNAEFWVEVPSVATGASIYMCYGNAAVTTYQGNDAGAWNPAVRGYLAFWHGVEFCEHGQHGAERQHESLGCRGHRQDWRRRELCGHKFVPRFGDCRDGQYADDVLRVAQSTIV